MAELPLLVRGAIQGRGLSLLALPKKQTERQLKAGAPDAPEERGNSCFDPMLKLSQL
jgi:hypothetical protein